MRRKPIELHRAQGTLRHDRHGDGQVPTAPPADAAPPAWAALDGHAEECYGRIAAELVAMNVLAEADVGALVQLARRYSDYMAAAEDVRLQGTSYSSEGRNGLQVRANPSVAMRDRAWQDFQRGLAEFGLTPTSRSRVSGAAMEPTDDPFASLFTPLR